ncbi:MAG: NAD(P)-dependent oxidoreductase [Caulobacteraceae bacterium]|nr:NAD(P)-dependent oxidoreductase [Caulobacteraceae bacterium]
MYLIAGGAGFLGLNTAKALAAAGEDVVITTRRRSDPLAAQVVAESKGRVSLEVVDLNNDHEVYNLLSRHDFQGVVHTATNHMFAQSRSANFTSYNMLFNTLEAAMAFGVKRFVLASSQVVYRGHPGPWREDVAFDADASEILGDLLKFVPSFEVTFKRVLEMVTLDYGVPIKAWDRAPSAARRTPRPQLETAVVRFATQCGPYYTSMYNPTACLAHALAHGHDSLPPDRALRPINDIAYVRDNADGLATVLLAERLPHRIYNVSSDLRVTGAEIAQAAHRVAPEAAQRLGLKPEEQAAGTTTEYFDVSRMKDDFGWTPKFNSIDAMLGDYVEWLSEHSH